MAKDIFPLGFHAGTTGHFPAQLIRAINAAGKRAFVKVVDSDGRAEEALQIGDSFGIENVAVFRVSKHRRGIETEAPDALFRPGRPMEEIADEWWQRHHDQFVEIDAARTRNGGQPMDRRIWFELANETNRNTYQQQGEMFAIIARKYALPGGWRICAPGSNSGEPESWAGWEDYFKLCALHPEQLAVAIHYYEWRIGDSQHNDVRFADSIPHLVGREEKIYEVCDRLGINYPVIHVTEGGFKHDMLPGWNAQVNEWIDGVSKHIGEQPNVSGIAWWCAQRYQGNIHHTFNNIYIPEFIEKARNWVAPPQLPWGDRPDPDMSGGQGGTTPAGTPWQPSQQLAVYLLAPQSLSASERLELYELAWNGVVLANGDKTSGRHTVTYSHDDAFNNVVRGAAGSLVIIVEPQRIGTGITADWMAQHAANVRFEMYRLSGTNLGFGLGGDRVSPAARPAAAATPDGSFIEGWIYNRELAIDRRITPPAVTVGSTKNVRSGPSLANFPNALGQLHTGVTVELISTLTNGYYKVRIPRHLLSPA